jgi:hypothetical protein
MQTATVICITFCSCGQMLGAIRVFLENQVPAARGWHLADNSTITPAQLHNPNHAPPLPGSKAPARLRQAPEETAAAAAVAAAVVVATAAAAAAAVAAGAAVAVEAEEEEAAAAAAAAEVAER